MPLKPPNKKKLPKLMSLQYAAEVLGVCRNTVANHSERLELGQFLPSAPGAKGRRFLTPDDVVRLASEIQEGPGRPPSEETSDE